mmetsp:Transcript_20150/g.37482  ORF Transcript_20150/g.37482 Transcript_20150/m.37482 type:complete len:676 (+) Transcript_20150:218-2245(+)
MFFEFIRTRSWCKVSTQSLKPRLMSHRGLTLNYRFNMEDKQTSTSKSSACLFKFKEGLPLDEVASFFDSCGDEVAQMIALASGLSFTDVTMISYEIEQGKSHSTISEEKRISADLLSIYFPEFFIPQSEQALLFDKSQQGFQNSQNAEERKKNERDEMLQEGEDIEMKSYARSDDTDSRSVAIRKPLLGSEEQDNLESRNKKKLKSVSKLEIERLYSIKANKLYIVTIASSQHIEKKFDFYFNEQCVCTEVPKLGLYVTGGLTPDSKIPSRQFLRAYDRTLEYAEGPEMINPHANHSAIFFEGFLYVVGQTKCERLDVRNNTWSPMPDLPYGILTTGLVASITKDCLYICRSNWSEVWLSEFSIPNMMWTKLSIDLLMAGIKGMFRGASHKLYILYDQGVASYNLKANRCKPLRKAEIGNLSSVRQGSECVYNRPKQILAYIDQEGKPQYCSIKGLTKRSRMAWKADLYGCHQDLCCCLGIFFCPLGCCIAQALVLDTKYEGLLNPFGNIACCCLGAALNRQQYRKEHGIEGSFESDCMTHMFCGPCAASQEWRDHSARGKIQFNKTWDKDFFPSLCNSDSDYRSISLLLICCYLYCSPFELMAACIIQGCAIEKREVGLHCPKLLCCWCFGLGAALNRRAIRLKSNIEGYFLLDLLAHLFCCVCAALQEKHEVR